ncbi:hypothetical protein [Sediminibacterium ginsengisoli]|uniref:Lipoprotein n=1 Tax=Sediminibacterium ginsengisoli TaxID=413434 RepID=A0A1T4L053_9BACT|nr:hypothetical protein [Sediminibacterium ginsengisoli]SJZ47978.1 hypothetical protein SAMN04488132_102220 [Sediminibacterium ginsengisoli]
MKQFFSRTYVVMIAMFTLAVSCKKDDGTSGGTGTGATVTCRYGFDGNAGTDFKSTQAGIVQTTVAGITTFGISAIRDGGKEAITITLLKKVTATGKIQFGPSASNGGIVITKDYTKPADGSLNYSSDNRGASGTAMTAGGEVVITKLDGNYVEGTFYVLCYNSNGKEAFAEQGQFKGTIN